MIDAILAKLREILEAAGARGGPRGKLYIVFLHYLGTCRMGENPATSVVNP
jgi:choline dehydrogenase-like flavoprotein